MAVVPHVDHCDPISPTLIEHRLEAGSHGETGELLFHYNHLHYQFDVPAGKILVRIYLHDIERASLFLPNGMLIDHPDAKSVMSYLASRFAQIDMLGEAGYVRVWPRGDGRSPGIRAEIPTEK